METVTKVATLLFISVMRTTNFDLNNYLGKPINEFDTVLVNGHLSNVRKMYKLSDSEMCLYGYSIKNVYLHANDSNNVVDITVHFPMILDKLFYDHIVELYGLPKKVLKVDKIIERKASLDKDGSSVSSKTYSTKEVNFEDKPTIIIWETQTIKIDIIYNYLQGATKMKVKMKE